MAIVYCAWGVCIHTWHIPWLYCVEYTTTTFVPWLANLSLLHFICCHPSISVWRQIKSPNIQKQTVLGEMRKDALTDGHPHSLSQVWMCVCVCVCAYVHIPWPLVSSSSPLHPKRKQIGSDCALLPSSFFPSHLFCKPFFGKYYLIPFLYLCVFSLPLCIILLPWAKRTLSRSFMPLALAPPPPSASQSQC